MACERIDARAPHKLTTSLGEAIVADNDEQVERDLASLWSEASAALKAALADESRKAVAAETLGGAAVAEDAAEMALLLAQAQTVIEIRTRLPKPVVQLTQDDVWFLCDMVDRLAETAPDFAPYVALVVLGRLERPWEVLRLITAISRKATDIAISGTDMDIVGELLFSDLDAYAANIQSARPINFDPDEVLASLAGFTELSSGMIKELGIRRDGKWGQRLAKDRAAVAQIMENLLQRARKEILAALPPHKGFAFARTAAEPRSVHADDPERVAQGDSAMPSSIAHSRPFAVAGAFSARLMKVTDETALALRIYAEDILTELRATTPEARHARRRTSQRHALALRIGPGRGRDGVPPPARPRARGLSYKRSRRLTSFVPYRGLHSKRIAMTRQEEPAQAQSSAIAHPHLAAGARAHSRSRHRRAAGG